MRQVSTVADLRVHRAGWPFIGIGALVTVVLAAIWQPAGGIAGVATLWMAYFFRDPDRVTPTREGLILSPADGIVRMIARAAPPPELGMDTSERTRVSIFLNVFDVHVNRAPADGTVAAVHYRQGKFVNASFDKASEDNERVSVRLALSHGGEMAFVQIAGLIARRIVCDLKEGAVVRAGERFGIIRFGSRVDVYLPDGASPLVALGQRAIGGETVLADLASAEGPRTGEVR
jgi:phosphatidylserine decarboxylase